LGLRLFGYEGLVDLWMGIGKGGGGGGAYTSGEGVGLAASGGMLAGISRLWMEMLTLCHSVLDVVHRC
jgi:hypothetical protein